MSRLSNFLGLSAIIEEGSRANDAADAWALAPLPVPAPPTVQLDGPDDTNPKDLIGQRKVQLHLVPSSVIVRVATAMMDGAKKYGPYNWRAKKVRATVYLSAAERHHRSWLDGETYAPDSGVHHLAHAAACYAIIIDAEDTGNLIDDRPLPGATARLLAELTTESPA